MTSATETAVAVKSKATKVKKASAPKKTRAHPPYVEMIKEAIVALKERTGSSQYAIGKYIEDKQNDLPSNFKKLLLIQLKKLVASGKLTKVKASFKLATVEKPKPATTTAAKKAPSAEEKKAQAKKQVVTAKATPVKVKKAAQKPKAVVKKPKKVAKTATVTTPGKKAVKPTVVKVKKTPAKTVKKPKSIKSPAKKVAARKAKK